MGYRYGSPAAQLSRHTGLPGRRDDSPLLLPLLLLPLPLPLLLPLPLQAQVPIVQTPHPFQGDPEDREDPEGQGDQALPGDQTVPHCTALT